jgi:hypothetical protein
MPEFHSAYCRSESVWVTWMLAFQMVSRGVQRGLDSAHIPLPTGQCQSLVEPSSLAARCGVLEFLD